MNLNSCNYDSNHVHDITTISDVSLIQNDAQISLPYTTDIDINSNYQWTNSNSVYSYDKNVPQYVIAGQNTSAPLIMINGKNSVPTPTQNVTVGHSVNMMQNMTNQQNSTTRQSLNQNVIVEQNIVYNDHSIGQHEKLLNHNQSYVPSVTEGTDLNVTAFTSANTELSSVNGFEDSQGYLYNVQETVAANQTIISNPYTGFGQYPTSQLTNSTYQIAANNQNMEIITSSNLSQSQSMQSSADSQLLQNSQNNSLISLADILIDQSASSSTLSASDFEVLSSCLQITQDEQTSVRELSVRPEVPLTQKEARNVLYSDFNQQSEVAANEDCVTSNEGAVLTQKTVLDNDSSTLVASSEDRKKVKRRKMVVWDDISSLPEKISLPLPSYCDCDQIEIDLDVKTESQSYVKNDKTLILHHVGRVVINNIELCSFVRNKTAFVSRSQLHSTGIFNSKAHKLFSTCGRTFPSFIDRLLNEEKDYMKQKGFMSATCNKLMLFSVGFVRWILDYLTRKEDDSEQTTVYERYLGHNCLKYKNIKTFQAPDPPSISMQDYLRSKSKNKSHRSNRLTTCVVKNPETNDFLMVQIGRLTFDDKILAAFTLEDGRPVMYVNCFQVMSFATGVTEEEFYALVEEFNCDLIACPDSVNKHFMDLKQKIPKEFFKCKWLEYENFKQICSCLFGRLDKYPCKSYISQIVKSKPKGLFGPDLKTGISKITFPVSAETTAQQSTDILSMAAASADIIDSDQTDPPTDPPTTEIKANPKQKTKLPRHDRSKQHNTSDESTEENQSEFQEKNNGMKTNETQTYDDELREPEIIDIIPKSTSKNNSSEKINSRPSLTSNRVNDSEVKTIATTKNSVQNNQQSVETECTLNSGNASINVTKAKLSSAMDTIGSKDFLNNSFDLKDDTSDSPSGNSKIDGTRSSNILAPVGKENFLSITEKTISSNPNVTVIANNQDGEIFECVPLFSLADMVQRDEGAIINPYSPLRSATKQMTELLDDRVYTYNQSVDIEKPAVHYKDSFDESFGPMKKNGLNSKTLNEVILGKNVSDLVLSPKKNGSPVRLTTSIFDTPKTSPVIDRSGHRSPRFQSLYQKFNQLERDATPDTSLHFFAEIASATEDMNESQFASPKKRSKILSCKSLKNIQRVSQFLQKFFINNGKIAKSKFSFNVKFKKFLKNMLEESGDQESTRKALNELIKFVGVLITKIWAISHLQKHIKNKAGSNIKESQTDATKESQTPSTSRGQSVSENLTDPRIQNTNNLTNSENKTKSVNTEVSETQTSSAVNGQIEIISDQVTTKATPDKESGEPKSVKSNTHIRTRHSPKVHLNFDTREKVNVKSAVSSKPPDVILCNSESETSEIELYDSNTTSKSKNTQNVQGKNSSGDVPKETNSPGKQIRKKRKLKDIFPQNEDLELNQAIWSIQSEKSGVTPLISETSTAMSNVNGIDVSIDLSKSHKNTTNSSLSQKCPALLESLLKPSPFKNVISHTETQNGPQNSVQEESTEENAELLGKRKRKRPLKFSEEYLGLPKKKRKPKKRNDYMNSDYYLAWKKSRESKTLRKTSDENGQVGNSNQGPSNELLVFIPSASGNNISDTSEETELIPASHFRKAYSGKTVKDLLEERDGSLNVQTTNKTPTNEVAKSGLVYSVIDSNGQRIVQSESCKKKTLMGSLVGENKESGETYEIFQSV